MAKKQDRDLGEYRRKRDPARTTEPFDPEPVRSRVAGHATRNGAFVVHQHDATRMHWDLRIEVGGALESFAVPRGPSLRVADKRLAIHTEAHPLAYLDFEDVIPAGNYGAGAMIAWDRGRVRYLETSAEQGIESGKIDFELWGNKLRGRFALVKTTGGPNHWLLLKKKDAWSSDERDVVTEEPLSVLSGLTVSELARADELAAETEARAAELGAREGAIDGRRVRPMLCSMDGVGLVDDGWLYELKIDGVRIVAEKRGDEATLSYRTGRAATFNYPEIARAVRALFPKRVVLDGEIVAFDERGRPSFQTLGRRIHVTRPGDVARLTVEVPVVFVVFDVLAVGARDLTGLPLRARKEVLHRIVRGKGLVRVLDHLEDDGRPLWAFCEQMDLEGLVAKRAESPYRQGPKRTPDWVKIKREREDDFVIVGFCRGEGGRTRLGSLDVASFEGDRLIVRGKVGSGLSEQDIDALLPELEARAVSEPMAGGEWHDEKGGRTYVRPELVVSVRYQTWSDGGSLRGPVFRGLRPDIDIDDCTAAPKVDDDPVYEAAPAEDAIAEPKKESRIAGRRSVPLTNQRKVFWPDEGYTKGDLCSYYESISPWLLPYLRERPVMLVRYPDGIRGKNFYQWRVPRGAPSWVRAFQVRSPDNGGAEAKGSKPKGSSASAGGMHARSAGEDPATKKDVTTFIVDDLDTLLYIANLGCIPLHVLASRIETLDECDFITLDFDVKQSSLRQAIELVRDLRWLLDRIGLRGYPKTSGQSGLHVFVPMGPGIGYDTAKALVELLGRILVGRHADIATMERVVEKRGARVLVDTGQTGRSRTIVAPWSVRAYPGATVSTPLDWDEVGLALDPSKLTMFTVLERVERAGDPMGEMLSQRPDVKAAVAALGELLEKP